MWLPSSTSLREWWSTSPVLLETSFRFIPEIGALKVLKRITSKHHLSFQGVTSCDQKMGHLSVKLVKDHISPSSPRSKKIKTSFWGGFLTVIHHLWLSSSQPSFWVKIQMFETTRHHLVTTIPNKTPENWCSFGWKSMLSFWDAIFSGGFCCLVSGTVFLLYLMKVPPCKGGRKSRKKSSGCAPCAPKSCLLQLASRPPDREMLEAWGQEE